MPNRYQDRPPASFSFGGYRTGDSIADIIMARGQAAADAELRGGEIWGNAFQNIGQTLAGGLQEFKTRRDDQQVQRAVRAATMGQPRKVPGFDVNGAPGPETAQGPDVRSILDSLPQELQGRAMKGIQDWQDMLGKRAEADARLQKLQQEIAETRRIRQQKDIDTLAMGAGHAKGLLDTPVGAIQGANMLYSAAKANGLADDRFDDFMASANDAWKAAQGDPRAEAIFHKTFVEQVAPVYDGLVMRASDDVQEKLANRERGVAVGENTSLKNPFTGKVIAEGTPKEETRSIDVQLAAAAAKGDTVEYGRLLKVKADAARAGRDPDAAAARSDARAAREQGRIDTRMDRSFQFNSSELERTAKPLTEQAERFGRLVETVNAKTPQADSLIAPELLTVMAGGSGSGLRINKAEIENVLGGRTNFESVKAALNKWQLDPSKGLSVTDAQRAQIQALIGSMRDRITAKADALNEARAKLVDADSVEEQRRIMADLKKKLTDVGSDSGGEQPRLVSSPAEARRLPKGTLFRTPDGRTMRVP